MVKVPGPLSVPSSYEREPPCWGPWPTPSPPGSAARIWCGPRHVGCGSYRQRERSRFCHLAVDPSRGPPLQTGPSPLDPWRCLPTSIPVQTLSVDTVTELLPPSLSLSLGHHANYYCTSSSNSESRSQSRVLIVSDPPPSCAQGFLGNVVLVVAPPHSFNTTPRKQRAIAPAYCAQQAISPPCVTSSEGEVRRPDFCPTCFCAVGMAAPRPVSSEAPFDPSKAPVIEGFSPTLYTNPEGFKEKFIRKTRENPMVPIGCLGTAAALTYGLYCFHRGQSHRSQLMMRTRIAAQGFTVVAILLGLAASAMKSRP